MSKEHREAISNAMKKKWALRRKKEQKEAHEWLVENGIVPLKDESNPIRSYACSHCGYEFPAKKDSMECEKKCLFMINCYMESNKVTFEEAKKMFLMELI